MQNILDLFKRLGQLKNVPGNLSGTNSQLSQNDETTPASPRPAAPILNMPGNRELSPEEVDPRLTENNAPNDYIAGNMNKLASLQRPRVAADAPVTENVPAASAPILDPASTQGKMAERNRIGNLKAGTPEFEQEFDKHHDSVWKNLGKGLLMGLQNYDSNTGLGGLIGALGTGAALNTFNPHLDEQLAQKRKTGEMDTDIARQQQFERNQAQTDNIYADNAQKAQSAQDLAGYRADVLNQKTAQLNEQNKQKTLDRILKRGYFDPATAPAADKAELAKYGIKPEDIGKFDNRNPVLKQIGGTTFKFNRETGSFEQTDLPKDQSKETVDFVVTGQDGQPHTYKVSQEKAAGFQSQMNALGMKADLARELQGKQQSFQADENEKNRAAAKDRLQQSLATKTDEQKQQLVTTALNQWKANYRKANNGQEPDQGAIYDAQERIKNTLSFSNQPLP